MTTASTRTADDRKTLLLVDDTPENLTLLGEILMPFYRVRAANSGVRALAAAQSEPRPDVILLDVMMPEMDGYAVISKLKAAPETRDIPVIFVTALDDAMDEARGLALGAADYIAKPVRPPILLARVRSQLELREARQRMLQQNAWLESEVARRTQQNREIRDAGLNAVAMLAETRDTEAANHVLRTQAYLRALANSLATQPAYASLLPPATIDLYCHAALLHDIGKVSIPDGVLRKVGGLTPEERALMQTHAQRGADAIGQAMPPEADAGTRLFLGTAMDIARSHHERWDGQGYPRGLRGEEIPLAARLMALVDVFEALMIQRVYKPAFPIEQTRQLILDSRGRQFDPAVVDAFVDCSDEFRLISERYADPPPVTTD